MVSVLKFSRPGKITRK